ncbi:PilN domain-containing protein [Coralloluteibacterium thermophilus]|uniref:PilN domain-containing protein n=1 Tax=Coralloluteibacterium thermophilum TaxID=2707049 RepID=A0ABV9NQC8_9GAMM
MQAVERLRDPLARLRTRYATSRAPDFFVWWRQRLAECLPARWRGLLGRGPTRVFCRVEPDALALWSDDAAAGERLRIPADALEGVRPALEAAWRRERRPRWLLLPAAQVLRRRMSLPLAAGERLREVLGFELDRQTPFRADQVHFDFRLLGRDVERRQLDVELVVLPRAALDAALARMGAMAADLDGVDVEAADAPQGRLGLNLLPSDRRAQRRDPARPLKAVLGLTAVLATGFALWQTLENRRDAVEALRAAVAERRAEAQQVQALRTRLEDSAGGASFLAEQRNARPGMVALLDDLTRRIPDGTSLERLVVNGDRVSMIGLSDQASALVAGLQASPLLDAPALSGSVQNDARSGRERFTLVAGLVAPAATEVGDAAPAP